MTVTGTRLRPRRRWVWVLVALATAAAFVVPFRLRFVTPAGMQHATQVPVSYLRAIRNLEVTANGGVTVMIRAGQPGRVTVGGVMSWTLRKPTVSQAWQGGTFLLGATCPKLNPFGTCGASIVIGVPAGTAVQVQAGAGSVTVAGLTGPLHLSATSGLLTARNISGPVWASVTSGSLVARTGVSSQRFDAFASTGYLAIDFSSRPRSVAVGLGSGSASITVPPGSRYRIVSSGPLYVTPGLSDSRSDLVLTATVGAGVARVGYPGGR